MGENGPLNVVLVGDSEVGKSTLISKCHHFHPTSGNGGYFTQDFQIPSYYRPTSLRSYLTNIYLSKEDNHVLYSVFRARIIDTGGERRYDYARPLAYMNADVFLLCFDITNRTSFLNVSSRWLPEIREYEPQTPVILVGTKSDLRSRRQITEAEIHLTSRNLGLDTCIEITSYSDKAEVSTLFDKAVQLAFTYSKDCLNSRHKKSREAFDITTLETASDPPACPKDSSSLASDWQATLHNKRRTDVILTFPDQSPNIHAHKFVLTLGSTTFRKLFIIIEKEPYSMGLENSYYDNNSSEILFPNKAFEETRCSTCYCFILNSENSVQGVDPNEPLLRVLCSQCRDKKEVDEEGSRTRQHQSKREALPIEIIFNTSIKRPAFLCILEWMYTGKLDITEETNLNFIKNLQLTATELGIEPLQLVCRTLFQSRLPHLPSARSNNQEQHDNIPNPPPLPPILPARSNNQEQHNNIPNPPLLPPVLPPARSNNQEQHDNIPIPPPLPPILPSSRSNNQEQHDNIPSPPPLPPILPSARGNIQEQHDNIPSPPPLPPVLLSKLTTINFNINVVSAYQNMWGKAHNVVNYDIQPDLVLVVGDASIAVHRVVLITRSSVMAAMLDGCFKEKDFKTVDLPGVSLDHFRTVLKFMYTDRCVLDETNVQYIIELADRFNIPSLLERCEQYMIHYIDNIICSNYESIEQVRDFVMDTICFSEMFNAQFLHKWCLYFVATNYDLFEQEKDFKTVWLQNKEYMESNRWPTRNHIDALKRYKMSKKKRSAKMSRTTDFTTKCSCCIS